jgi:hypothetical protein
VEAFGLAGAKELNGQHGTVTGKKHTAPGEAERWGVRFDAGEVKALKLDNLKKISDSPERGEDHDHDDHAHAHDEWGVIGEVLEGVAHALEEEEEALEHDMDERDPSEPSSATESSAEFSVHRVARTPGGVSVRSAEVRYSLPPHDPADHMPPPSDTDASYSEDESALPEWCRSWKNVNKLVEEQSRLGAGGSHELLTKNKQAPLRCEQVFPESRMSESRR